MKIKKTVKAQSEMDEALKDLKKEEIVQVISTTGENPVVGFLITQEHYMELVSSQNNSANLFNKEFQGKIKEAGEFLNKAQKVFNAVINEEKKPKN